jgi:hypothetical protein
MHHVFSQENYSTALRAPSVAKYDYIIAAAAAAAIIVAGMAPATATTQNATSERRQATTLRKGELRLPTFSIA